MEKEACKLCFLRSLEKAMLPFSKEWPFVVTFVVMMGLDNFRSIRAKVFYPDPTVTYTELFGRITVCLLMAYMLAWCLIGIRKTWFKVTLYALCFILFVVQTFCITNFSLRISPQLITLLAETNTHEASEFINQFVFSSPVLSTVAWACLLGLTALAFEYINRKYRFSRLAKHQAIPSVVIILLLLWGCYLSRVFINLITAETTEEVTQWDGNCTCSPTDPISGLLYGIRGVQIAGQEMEKSVQTTKMMDRNNSLYTEDDSVNVVFVIGESFIKHHAGIYGYSLNTTPYLEEAYRQGNLFIFNDAVTPYASTSRLIRNLLCCNSTSRREQWFDHPMFLAIFKDAGYNVFLWDNQLSMGPNAGFAFALNSFLYNKEIKSIYTKYNEKGYQYDEELLQSFKKEVKLSHNYNFVVFHLNGQHHDTQKRFPHTPDNIFFQYSDVPLKAKYLTKEKKQEIADYDNATRYNDKIMKEIFDMFKDDNTVVVYLSDHGEEIYDYRDSKGRVQGLMTREMAKFQYEIPFMIWCSEKYKNHHPDIAEAIRRSVNRPIMSDDICHLMFHLGGIKTRYYRPERDFISQKYKPYKRIIKETTDYDSIRFDK